MGPNQTDHTGAVCSRRLFGSHMLKIAECVINSISDGCLQFLSRYYFTLEMWHIIVYFYQETLKLTRLIFKLSLFDMQAYIGDHNGTLTNGP